MNAGYQARSGSECEVVNICGFTAALRTSLLTESVPQLQGIARDGMDLLRASCRIPQLKRILYAFVMEDLLIVLDYM